MFSSLNKKTNFFFFQKQNPNLFIHMRRNLWTQENLQNQKV